jgi:hypothetical protein
VFISAGAAHVSSWERSAGHGVGWFGRVRKRNLFYVVADF